MRLKRFKGEINYDCHVYKGPWMNNDCQVFERSKWYNPSFQNNYHRIIYYKCTDIIFWEMHFMSYIINVWDVIKNLSKYFKKKTIFFKDKKTSFDFFLSKFCIMKMSSVVWNNCMPGKWQQQWKRNTCLRKYLSVRMVIHHLIVKILKLSKTKIG